MSLNLSNIEAKTNSAEGEPRRGRRAFLFILLGLIIVFLILWFQRFAIIEMSARKSLANEKIIADFSIIELTSKQAVIEDIRLSRGEDKFFSAKRVAASYHWKDALKFNFVQIDVFQPSLDLEIDEQGQIISEWMPNNNGRKGQAELPFEKLRVTDGNVKLTSPFGNIRAAIDADIESLSNGEAKLKIDPAPIVFSGFSGVAGGNIEAKLSENKIALELDLDLPNANYGGMSGRAVNVNGSADLALDNKKVLGSNIKLSFGSAAIPDIEFGKGVATWLGNIAAPAREGGLPKIAGEWSVDLQKIGVTNIERRERLAKSLTLNETISSLSSIAPFGPDLFSLVDDFLIESEVNAAGAVLVSDNKRTVTLSGPATFKSRIAAQNLLTLRSSKKSSNASQIFHYDPKTQISVIEFGGNLSGDYGLSISTAKLRARSEGGRTLSNILSFDADIITHTEWRAKTPLGKPVRLAPMQAKIAYETQGDVRKIRMSAGLDFDGDVPGGYVKKARAQGDITLTLEGDQNRVTFKQSPGNPVKAERLETITDWAFEDLIFDLKSTAGPLYYRNGQTRNITAALGKSSGRMINVFSGKDMEFELDSAQALGIILPAKQNWSLTTQNAHMTSDSFPSPGTDVFAQTAQLAAEIKPGHPVTIKAHSPSADIKTQLISAKNMSIEAAGEPNALNVAFGQGLVKFSAGELPILPLQGEAGFDGQKWSGTAQTSLPRARETPIFVAFEFEDGIGTADIKFDDMQFMPRGLQPKHLVSALAGKVSQVNGAVSSNIHLSFGANQPLKSSGTLSIKDMAAGTLPGPLSGMNSEMTFSSFFPLQTDGPQTLKLGKFDPGFPMEDGEVSFEVIPDGIRLHSARWPLGSGHIKLQPTVWLYSAPQNRVSLEIENVELGEFLQDLGGGRFSATGNVSGSLPVLIEGVKVHVENGKLSVKDGGVIQYNSPQTDAAGEANEYAGYAFDALKNFEYQELEAELNGPLDGNMKLRMKFDGANPKVLYGSQFRFNIGVEGELLNIARSFQVGTSIKQQILQQIQDQQASRKADLETTPR